MSDQWTVECIHCVHTETAATRAHAYQEARKHLSQSGNHFDFRIIDPDGNVVEG